MKNRILAALLVVILSSAQARAQTATQPIDLVICLDTSGSMELLIDSAFRSLVPNLAFSVGVRR